MKQKNLLYILVITLVSLSFIAKPNQVNAITQIQLPRPVMLPMATPSPIPTLAPLPTLPSIPNFRVCNPEISGTDLASCHARVIADASGNAKNFIAPAGINPQQLRAAYGAASSSGNGKIIAIVDAYDHPRIKSDLDTYSNQFGLPVLPDCSGNIASSPVPCFKKVDQRGSNFYPSRNSGWGLEIALDVEAAHAVCPDCSILLVESSSNSFNNLLAGIDRAAILGAKVISNSWGGGEFSSETAYDSRLNKPGIAITVSSGDSGYGVEYPAASQYVTAVGGTTLNMSGLNYLGETAWNGAGSGCSLYEFKPAWQTDVNCPKRSVADVSADADPATGAAVYDSYAYSGRSGWFQVGGTSLAAPIIAAIYAISGNTIGSANNLPYSLGTSTNLHDITSGNNGVCGGSYLCNAGTGYDGPTGLGSPNGTTAF